MKRIATGVAMNGRIMLIAMLLPILAGCESYRWLVYASPPITGEKQGQDCRALVLGLGGTPDLSGIEAMRLGGIKKVQSIEYLNNSIQGVGSECVVARGE